ncbi:DUF5691 domain-containing protein [Methylobacterium oryzisoli]|uniref:DUF5691 domain-containing protein n=1 Tax=Methylobacterium oryzisoli TaxID=3385502 RepID=UPI00389261F6
MDAATIAAPAADGWETALAAALIGAERALAGPAGAPFADLGPAGDAGGGLLARLAAQGVHRLAGAGLAPDALTPVPKRSLPGPECPPAAAARLALLLAAGQSARSRLEEWCGLAAEAGIRAPAWLLPALSPYRSQWPRAIERIAGPEIDWLDRACAGGSAEAASSPQDWTEGTPAIRRDAFAAFRQRDPDGAREALEAGFRGEKADMRQVLVAALDIGLGEADAPFLEACLDDRASGVRAAAQRLLADLPRSLFASRMAARAKKALVIESSRGLLGGTKHALTVTLPEESPTLARDGIEPRPYRQKAGGARAGLLQEILSQTPLHAFAEHPPRLWIELALRSEWAGPILEGFVAAVRREDDPDWARALAEVLGEAAAGRLSGIRPTNELRDDWARAAALLPGAEWESLVEGLFRKAAVEVVLAHLGHAPSAFSERFTLAHLDWLAVVTRAPPGMRDPLTRTWMIDRFGERAWPGEPAAAAAAAILARLPADADERLRRQCATLAEILDLRAAMRRDFTGPEGA